MSGREILIVEEEGLKELLELEGYRVRTARNGREALALLRQSPEPKLILLDLMMPVMNGSDFCKELRGNPEFSAHRVIVMSADSNIQDRVRSMHVEGYLRKPVEVEDVLQIVVRNFSG